MSLCKSPVTPVSQPKAVTGGGGLISKTFKETDSGGGLCVKKRSFKGGNRAREK
jgi:hypothetical protein